MDAPCAVCGNNDTKLVDGFYYCIECGTQDTNVRETVVEQTMLADGTIQLGTARKIQTVTNEGIQMSGEWYKWHAFNFILMGLVDELICLGAKPSFKMKVLWIWTRYIKKFQNKEKLKNMSSSFLHEEENPSQDINSDSASEIDFSLDDTKTSKKCKKKKKPNSRLKNITTNLLLSILYVGLNLDKSNIQLSHLFQFLREDRLSLLNWAKFIPSDIKIKQIPDWIRFEKCNRECSRMLIHRNSINLLKGLNLGTPVLPDLNKIVDNFIKELCLPSDFRDLVFSLMNLIPCDFLILCSRDTFRLKKIPDYEVTVMGYVLIAMKMCFGLDDDYEIRLSDAVDNVNESEDNNFKSYKLGSYSTSSSRLFSFRDWTKHLQLRRMILSRFYLPIAWQNNTEADDYVLIEQSATRNKGTSRISDEITMDILNKLSHTDDGSVIPKSEFTSTLTPMTTYLEVILQYFQDPELKFILSEDFSQYSLKYAVKDLSFPQNYENLKHAVVGVNGNNKIKNKNITGTLMSKKSDLTEVYVRNCENKNWLKTHPPTVKHIKDSENASDSDSDHGYDSTNDTDNSQAVKTNDQIDQAEMFKDNKLEFITEEVEGLNIFDDTFENIKEEKTVVDIADQSAQDFEHNETVTSDHNLFNDDLQDDKSDIISCSTIKREFDPNNFNRAYTIKTLVLKACSDLKIPIPKEYRESASRETRKRQASNTQVTDGATGPKRTKRGNAKQEVNNILSSYYSRVENQLLNQISAQLANNVDNNTVNTIDNVNGSIHPVGPIEPTDENVDNRSEMIDDNALVNDVESNSMCNVDSSLIEGGELEAEEFVNKNDPRYDENTHDIKQLYVKIPDTNQTENIECLSILEEDPDLLKVINLQIEKFSQGNVETPKKDTELTNFDNSDSDSDYDIPLNVLQEEMKTQFNLQKRRKNLEFLIKHKNKIEFHYWIRHYATESFSKNLRMHTKFDIELRENFPKSFVFVLQECASIVHCQTFVLYKMLRRLEKKLTRFPK